MRYEYRTKGTCSQKVIFDLIDGVVSNVAVVGGCDGNLKGIGRLAEGMAAADVVARLSGIRCGKKPTSCPDQIARAVAAAMAEQGGAFR
ncbi:MAG: TIGR03905 family TSCPD domain-containing protein [Bacillota bacterium]|jgi:uncharacterized protein (TIGR03905 family)